MKNQETLKSQEKIQSIGTNSKMTQMLELSKDIKADIITGLQELRVNNFVINKKKISNKIEDIKNQMQTANIRLKCNN